MSWVNLLKYYAALPPGNRFPLDFFENADTGERISAGVLFGE
jgi:hypothetical protein